MQAFVDASNKAMRDNARKSAEESNEKFIEDRKKLGPIQKTSENIKGQGVSYYIPYFFPELYTKK